MIKKYALEVFRESNEGKDIEFTASDGWITNFMRRNGMATRERTHQVRIFHNQCTDM